MNYVSVRGVELAHVGMRWPASTGDVTLTLEHLADAQRAAMDDPHILLPRLKIGHEDPRFNESPPAHDPFKYRGPLNQDGNPVYGRVGNIRLANDGALLLGDYIDMPEWLGQAVRSAYPSRSLEGDWDIDAEQQWTLEGVLVEGGTNVETPGGKRYSFVLTAMALLGEPLPAISCLEDLEAMLTGGPAAVKAREAVAASRREAMPVDAAASVDAVYRQFVYEFAQGDRFWWWPVDIRVDPNEVIADDDEGHLFRVPFATDKDGNVTFSDPVRVVQEFRDVPVAAAVAVAAPLTDGQRVVARFASAVMARPHDRVRAANQTEGGSMDDERRKQLAAQLDLPEDATEEQVNSKLQENALAAQPPEPDPQPDPAPDPAPDPQPEPANASSAGLVVSVDREAWEQAKQDAQLGRDARMTQLSAHADQLVDEAKRDGRIAAASEAAWRNAILPPNATALVETEVQTLASLEKNRIPVEARSVAAADEGEQSTHAQIMAAAYGIDVTAGRGA